MTSKNAPLLGIAIAVFAGLVALALALLPPPESKTTPMAPLPGTAEIDLLAMIDPARDAVKGTWTMENGRLVSDDGESSRLEIPYVPSEEYSFTMEFKGYEELPAHLVDKVIKEAEAAKAAKS